MFGAKMQSCVTAVIASIDVASANQQKMNCFFVSLPNGIMQGPQSCLLCS